MHLQHNSRIFSRISEKTGKRLQHLGAIWDLYIKEDGQLGITTRPFSGQ
jgi:hypothetical protein